MRPLSAATMPLIMSVCGVMVVSVLSTLRESESTLMYELFPRLFRACQPPPPRVAV
jgi:hypothetical protein